jgi:TrmH family RNA methyltransferase
MNRQALRNVIVVLNEPQNLVNIAGVVRAMKNMGLGRLRLVRPAEFDAYRITGIAHRSDEIVDGAEFFDTLSDAVADCVYVLGTSARARTAQRTYGRPREFAPHLIDRAHSGPVAIVMGREDRGLANEDLDRCNAVAIIPTDPDYSSLNMAQAFLILAYEVLLAAEGESQPLPRSRRATEPATQADMEETYDALLLGLHRLEFFKARLPESVMRTIRTTLSRAEPELREARMFRAIGFEIYHYLNRLLGPLEDPVPELSGKAGSDEEPGMQPDPEAPSTD